MGRFICGVEENLKGRQLESDRQIAYHIVGKAKREWLTRRGGAHTFWIRKSEPDIDSTWPNDEIVDSIIQHVREKRATPEQTTEETVDVSSEPLAPDEAIAKATRQGERLLRQFVAVTLRRQHGEGDCCWCNSPWWREGIDKDIRSSLVQRKEQENSNASPFEWTGIADLKNIILSKKNWNYFADALQNGRFADKEDFSMQIDRFHKLRNQTMHSGVDKQLGDEDAEFARQIVTILSSLKSSDD